MKKILLILFVFATVIISCNKNDDTKYEAEPTGRWTLASIQLIVLRNGVEIENGIREYSDENYVEITENGNYTVVADESVISGKWEWADNKRALLLDKGKENESKVKIIELNKNSFILLNEEENDNSTTIKTTTTLKR